MEKVRVLFDSLRSGEPAFTGLRVWRYIALESAVSGLVERVVSEAHEEQVNYPTLPLA